MGFFGRRQQLPNGPTLPSDIVSRMQRFGRYELDPAESGENGMEQGALMAKLLPFASAEPERFLADLAAAVVPAGGLAVYGASRTVWELLSPDRTSPIRQYPAYKEIMDGALGFLRANGVPLVGLRGNEREYWMDKGGA